MMRIAVITNVESRKGLWRDGLILERALVLGGHEVQVIHFRDDSVLPRLAGSFDALLFCEVSEPFFYPLLRKGGYIVRKVNPEWEMPEKLKRSGEVDLFLCKTHAAYEAGADYWQDRALVIGFESEDILEAPSFGPGPVQFLHPCGGSIMRGTVAVLRMWQTTQAALPSGSWLHIVDPPETRYVETALAGTSHVTRYGKMPEESFRHLQRRCAVHIIPSEYEGWGHLFWEGLGLGATVIGTDGAWWAEAQGGYVPVSSQPGPRRHLAETRIVEPAALGSEVLEAARCGPVWQPHARAAFLAARERFRSRLLAAFTALEVNRAVRPHA